MRRYLILFLITCLICLTGFITDARADTLITYQIVKTASRYLPAGSIIHIFISPLALRIDTGGRISMVYNRGGSFIFIDHKRRTFVNVGGMLEEMETMQKEMKRELARIPPAQRKMMEAMMRSRLNIRISETQPCDKPRVIKEEPVNGIPAKVVDGCRTVVNGRWDRCRYWFVDGRKLGLNAADFKILSDFMVFQKRLLSLQTEMIRMEGMSFSYQPLSSDINRRLLKLPYRLPFVIKAATIEEGKEKAVMILKDLKVNRLNGEVFAIPSGYKDETPHKSVSGGMP